MIAVDPTSPYTGGAILGDRIRMQRHHADPGVFIRSMATRGWMGGLARAATDMAATAGCRGARCRHDRDRGRRTGRSGDRAPGRCDRGRAGARAG